MGNRERQSVRRLAEDFYVLTLRMSSSDAYRAMVDHHGETAAQNAYRAFVQRYSRHGEYGPHA